MIDAYFLVETGWSPDIIDKMPLDRAIRYMSRGEAINYNGKAKADMGSLAFNNLFIMGAI
jgi:hypothetical protein